MLPPLQSTPISRKSFLTIALGTAAGIILHNPARAHGKEAPWVKVYEDEFFTAQTNGSQYSITDIQTSKQFVYQANEGGRAVILTSTGTIYSVTYKNEEVLLNDTILYDLGVPTSNQEEKDWTAFRSTGNCVRMTSVNTTLSQRMSTDALVLSVLAKIPFYGDIFEPLAFASSIRSLLQSNNEVYMEVSKYYCDNPRRVKVVSKCYADQKHRRYLKTITTEHRL